MGLKLGTIWGRLAQWLERLLHTQETGVHAWPAGFQDASLWEEAKKKGDDAIKKLIDKELEYISVTVARIGAKTAGRKFITF